MPDILVSVIIATYNSSEFVIETLESISKQTWHDIELIITDDASIDDTVEVCRKWIGETENRFINCEILESDINTGVSLNANRGLKAAKGEWIKFLGADDTLHPTCIEDNMSYISSHNEVKILFSRVEVYRNTFEPQNLLETTPDVPYNPNGILASDRSSDSQYKMLLLCDRIHFTPSSFLHRDTILSVGGFDEKFRLLEDYPLWLNLAKNGHKLYFMDKITVNYRRHLKAINNTGDTYLVNPNYFKSEDFRKIYTYHNLPTEVKLAQRFTWYASQIFQINWLNRNNKLTRTLFNVSTDYLNPFRQFIRIRKIFNKSLLKNEFYQ